MPGISYFVDVQLGMSGNLAAQTGAATGGVDKLGKAASKLGSEMEKLGGRAADAFTGVVDGAGRVAMGLAKVGAGVALAGAVYGVTVLNNQLEATQTSIAAVLNAQGMVGNIDMGLERAGTLIADMKKDARDLPGEFSDLLNIFQSSAASAFKIGITDTGLEKLSAQAMAAGKAMSVPLDQAGRELAQLLEGRAGAHNVFGTRLGLDKSFNKLDEGKRVEAITAALAKYEPAIKAFGNTWDAQFSSAIDNGKEFALLATKPLFERGKQTLAEINGWFEKNRGTVTYWAGWIGTKLGNAFESGKRFIIEWWPLVSDFAGHAYDRLVGVWQTIEPYVVQFGEYFKDALKDPDGTLDKLGTVLKLYAAVKVGSLAGSMFGGLASSVGGGGGAMGAAGAAGATGPIVAGVLAGIVGNVIVADRASEVASGEREFDALDALNMHVAPLGSAFGLLYDASGKATGAHWENSKAALAAYDAASKMSKQFDLGTEAHRVYYGTVVALQNEAAILATYFSKASSAVGSFAEWASSKLAGGAAKLDPAWQPEPYDYGKNEPDIGAERHAYVAGMQQHMLNKVDEQRASALAARQGHLRGSGGTNIQKVEITVSSNQAPGQIARRVVDLITDLKRHPRVSRHVPNFSAG